MKHTVTTLISVVLVLPFGIPAVYAGLSDYVDDVTKSMSGSGGSEAAAALSNDEMIAGLKEALDKGTQFAVDKLGKDGGFLNNKKVRIPMPDSLSWVEKSLRTVGQDELADEFVATMNHAAEQAVPEAAEVFGDAIQKMSVEDATDILNGPDDAATQYFRTNTEAELTDRMRPIVEQATANTGVTSAYKNMTAQAGGMTSLLSTDVTDLDGYVTGKTLDGLFLMIAKEEKRIRENPIGRGSELMQKVFGAYTK
ncbi:MAG: DUF4197 domain-containing protein [Pseudomonadota bacterium]